MSRISTTTFELAGWALATGSIACALDAFGLRPVAYGFCLAQAWCLVFAIASAWADLG